MEYVDVEKMVKKGVLIMNVVLGILNSMGVYSLFFIHDHTFCVVLLELLELLILVLMTVNAVLDYVKEELVEFVVYQTEILLFHLLRDQDVVLYIQEIKLEHKCANVVLFNILVIQHMFINNNVVLVFV